mgnify:CR=1 FL=1
MIGVDEMSEDDLGNPGNDPFAALFAAAETAVDRIREERDVPKANSDEKASNNQTADNDSPNPVAKSIAAARTASTTPDRGANAAVTASLIKARNELGELLALEKKEHVALQAEHARMKARLSRFREQKESMQQKTERSIETAIQRERDKLVKSILPVLDNLERAVAFEGLSQDDGAQTQLTGFLDGLDNVVSLFRSTLKKVGVEGYSALGKPFDPALHEAIRRVADETVEANTVVEEYHRGYLIDGRLLRPALVVVASG